MTHSSSVEKPRSRLGRWRFVPLLALAGFGIGLALAGETPTPTWLAPARAARRQNPLKSDATIVAEGKVLYTQGCLPCHGPSGKGDGPAAATLERNGMRVKPGNLSDPKLWEQTDGALFWKISEGNTPMPAFQETFSEEQRWRIVTYVRTLAPK